VGAQETEKTRYKINKRKIFFDDSTFEEDEYAEMVLGAHKKVLTVSNWKNAPDCKFDVACSECRENCPNRCDELCFPCFAYDRAIIKYCDCEGKECFGINLCNCACDGMAECLYVVPLDLATVRERRFDDEFYDHVHVDLPLATLASIEELDETARESYLAFVAYLNNKQNDQA